MNIQSLLHFTCIGLLLWMVGCTSVDESHNSLEAEYTSAIKAAEESRTKAIAANNQWRDSNKFLKKANQLAAEKKYDKAIKHAKTAKKEFDMAVAQVQFNEEKLKEIPFYNPDATPEEDVRNIQAFFRDKFPELPDTEFANGFYAMDKAIRANWEAIEEFPPYIPAVDEGERLWNTPFVNGKTYEDCFSTAGVLTSYPRWDKTSGEVETLPMAINACRNKHGEKPLKYGKNAMLSLQAYIAHQSRGHPTSVKVPKDDPRAFEAYKQGKKFYFSRRGQINMACYHCHFGNAGNQVRANILGPALGQTTHWPTYRSKWGSMGSLHRRYKGCNKQVRAKPFDFQSAEYRNLEYFHTFISNGIPTNGPGARF